MLWRRFDKTEKEVRKHYCSWLIQKIAALQTAQGSGVSSCLLCFEVSCDGTSLDPTGPGRRLGRSDVVGGDWGCDVKYMHREDTVHTSMEISIRKLIIIYTLCVYFI